MREPLEIIGDIRGFISSNVPFRFPFQEEAILNFLAELENTLTLQPVVEEPIIEEPIIGEILEVTFSEPVLIKETVIEELIVEEVVDLEQNVLMKNEEGIFEEVAVSTVKVKRPRKK
jgi:hypothetical protein